MATPSTTTAWVAPSTRTVYSDASRVVISLPDDWGSAPAGEKVSTYLLDSQGRTTRTLGWPEGPTTSILLPAGLRTRSSRSSSSVPTTSSGAVINAADAASSPTQAGSGTSTSLSSQQAPASGGSNARKIALGVGGAVAAIVVIILAYVFLHRWKQRRARRASAEPVTWTTPAMPREAEPQANMEMKPLQPVEPVAIGPLARNEDPDHARTTTLPSPRRLVGPESAAKRRVPSKERLAPVNPVPEQWLAERNIHAPLPAPPSAAWGGFPIDIDYDPIRDDPLMLQMQTGPLSITEDYSTNAGEGSVDGYWHETASMREERLYRLQREGHTPPPPDTPRWPGPRNDHAAASSSGSNRLALIREDRPAGMSLIGGNAGDETDNVPAALASPTTNTEDHGRKRDSSGLGSSDPLI